MQKVLNSRLEAALRNRPWSIPETFLRDFDKQRGLLPFRSSRGDLAGTFLIDETLESPIRVVAYDAAPVDAVYVAACVQEAAAYRRKLAADGKLDIGPAAAYRLVNQTGDGFPGLAVDVYAEFALVHLYTDVWRPLLNALVEALLGLDGIRGVYLTERTRTGKQQSGHQAGERARLDEVDDQVLVIEHGLSYAIHLAAGPATGLYLDQRSNRVRLATLLAGGRLLNTFSYTCSFSMAATRQGSATVSVDLAKAALEQAKLNFARNGLNLAEHSFVSEDVFLFLPRLARRGEQFRAVLLDPPTFARGKKGTFTTEKNYDALVAVAAPLVEENGYLVAFANTHRMSEEQWLASVRQGLGDLRDQFRQVAVWGQDVDFRYRTGDPAGRYLKNVLLQRSAVARRNPI